jgi:hypothetical protein
MRKRTCIGLLVALTTLGTVAPAAADRPSKARPVWMDAHEVFTGEPGTFTAPIGGVCPSGTTISEVRITETIDGARFDGDKTFTCADGSGTFDLRFSVRVHGCDGFLSGTWKLTSGTGAYRSIRGGGTLVGIYDPMNVCEATSIEDHYRGEVAGVRS